MSNFMDGYSTNSQERREAEADAEWRSRVKCHELSFLDYFFSLNAEKHSDADISHMSEYMVNYLPDSAISIMVREALRNPAVREMYAPYVQDAAFAYAMKAAQ